MRKGRHDADQIAKFVNEMSKGRTIAELADTYGISTTILQRWRNKFSGLKVETITLLTELEEENHKLKRINADLVLEIGLAKEIIEKKH